MLKPKYDSLLDDIREDDNHGFITFGDTGVTTIRWQTSGGSIYDMTVNDLGAIVTTSVSTTLGSPYGLLLTLTQPS